MRYGIVKKARSTAKLFCGSFRVIIIMLFFDFSKQVKQEKYTNNLESSSSLPVNIIIKKSFQHSRDKLHVFKNLHF